MNVSKSVDLRHHTRFSSQLPATITFHNGQVFEVVVVDFSHGGMRIEWPYEPPALTDGIHTLHLSLGDQAVNVSVVWVFLADGMAGIKLYSPAPQLFLQLQEINQINRNSGGLTTEKRSLFRDHFMQMASDLIMRAPHEWLAAFKQKLSSLVSTGRNTTEIQHWLAIEKLVDVNTDHFVHTFEFHAEQQLRAWYEGNPKIEDEQLLDEQTISLELIEHDEFEDWLRCRVTSSHLQSKLNQDEFEVRQLIDTLSDADLEECFNPISPQVICESFQRALLTMTLDNKANEVAFDTLEQVMGSLLISIYRRIMDAIDIPLTFRYRRPNKQRSAETPTVVKETEATYNSEPQSSVKPTDSLANFEQHQAAAKQAYNNVQRLMALRNVEPSVVSQEVAQEHPTASISDIESLLKTIANESELAAESFSQLMEDKLAQQHLRLSSETRNAVDTMSTVAKHLLDNPDIADFVKPAIEQISWPLMRHMIHDASLMFNQSHPGRIILNLLAKLGKITDSGQQRLQTKLSQLMEKAAQYDALSNSDLELLLDNIQELVSNAEKKVFLNRERVAQSSAGEYQLEITKNRINNLIGRDMANRVLPECVIDWINNGWQPLLVSLVITEGAESPRFYGAVKLYRQVLLVFSSEHGGRSELIDKFTTMMKLSLKELNNLNGIQTQHQKWYDDILSAAHQHLENGYFRDAVDLPTYIEPAHEDTHTGIGARRANNLQVGDWLAIHKEAGITAEDVNLSIAWISTDGHRFACVNHTGMKVIDLTFNQLALGLENGRIVRLYEPEESAVDQSIDALVQQIYRDLSDQANMDPLTQLSNRQHFLSQLNDQLNQIKHSTIDGTLVFIDIDEFRVINSLYGTDIGDTCLKTVADIIRSIAPQSLIARVGSNEFSIYMEQDIEQAEATIRMLLVDLENHHFGDREAPFCLNLRAGLATWSVDLENANELLTNAQKACTLAKEHKDRKIVRHESRPNKDENEWLNWLKYISRSIDEKNIQLTGYKITSIQNKHNKQNRAIIKIIASVTKDDTCTQVPETIVNAAHFARRKQFDMCLLEKTFEYVLSNFDGEKVTQFIIPVGIKTILNSDMYNLIERYKKKGVPVSRFFLEVHESQIRDMDNLGIAMQDLRRLGIRFVCSEFGTNSRSYLYLKKLPFDYLHIAKTLFSDLQQRSADYALIKSIQEITHFMAKKTIIDWQSGPRLPIVKSVGIDYMIENQAAPISIEALTGSETILEADIAE